MSNLESRREIRELREYVTCSGFQSDCKTRDVHASNGSGRLIRTHGKSARQIALDEHDKAIRERLDSKVTYIIHGKPVTKTRRAWNKEFNALIPKRIGSAHRLGLYIERLQRMPSDTYVNGMLVKDYLELAQASSV